MHIKCGLATLCSPLTDIILARRVWAFATLPNMQAYVQCFIVERRYQWLCRRATLLRTEAFEDRWSKGSGIGFVNLDSLMSSNDKSMVYISDHMISCRSGEK
jgi:hypothetical protein